MANIMAMHVAIASQSSKEMAAVLESMARNVLGGPKGVDFFTTEEVDAASKDMDTFNSLLVNTTGINKLCLFSADPEHLMGKRWRPCLEDVSGGHEPLRPSPARLRSDGADLRDCSVEREPAPHQFLEGHPFEIVSKVGKRVGVEERDPRSLVARLHLVVGEGERSDGFVVEACKYGCDGVSPSSQGRADVVADRPLRTKRGEGRSRLLYGELLYRRGRMG